MLDNGLRHWPMTLLVLMTLIPPIPPICMAAAPHPLRSRDVDDNVVPMALLTAWLFGGVKMTRHRNPLARSFFYTCSRCLTLHV